MSDASRSESRAAPRIAVRYPTVVIPGSGAGRGRARMVEISRGGCRLELYDTVDLPSFAGFSVFLGVTVEDHSTMLLARTVVGGRARPGDTVALALVTDPALVDEHFAHDLARADAQAAEERRRAERKPR